MSTSPFGESGSVPLGEASGNRGGPSAGDGDEVDVASGRAPASHPADSARWRVGRKVGRTIYAMVSDDPSDNDVLIGVMDTPELAREAVHAHNRDHLIRDVLGGGIG